MRRYPLLCEPQNELLADSFLTPNNLFYINEEKKGELLNSENLIPLIDIVVNGNAIKLVPFPGIFWEPIYVIKIDVLAFSGAIPGHPGVSDVKKRK